MTSQRVSPKGCWCYPIGCNNTPEVAGTSYAARVLDGTHRRSAPRAVVRALDYLAGLAGVRKEHAVRHDPKGTLQLQHAPPHVPHVPCTNPRIQISKKKRTYRTGAGVPCMRCSLLQRNSLRTKQNGKQANPQTDKYIARVHAERQLLKVRKLPQEAYKVSL